MWPFKPKFRRIEDSADEKEPEPEPIHKEEKNGMDNTKIGAELLKIHAQLDSFSEIRNISNERFTRINQQIGELRGMILETNRSIQQIELKTTKAVDLVNNVQPEKLMIEVQKTDNKAEALKANLESNEFMMKSLMEQVKEIRNKMSLFRGVEELIKLSKEVRQELINIKKVDANVERHADKVETIFIEFEKRFNKFEQFEELTDDLNKEFKKINEEFDNLKIKSSNFADKREVEKLIHKVNDFEKHVGSIIDLLHNKIQNTDNNIKNKFNKLNNETKQEFTKKFDKTEHLIKALNKILKEKPELLSLLDKATKQALENQTQEFEKSEEESEEITKEDLEKQLNEEKESFLSKLFSKKEKTSEKK